MLSHSNGFSNRPSRDAHKNYKDFGYMIDLWKKSGHSSMAKISSTLEI